MVFDVMRVGFGAMQLPGRGVFGPPRDREQALAVLRRGRELGVDHIDTASYYGPEVADELIRAALHPYPEELRIVSKVGVRREGTAWVPALRPEQIRSAVETDLRVLQTEQLFAVNLRLGAGPAPEVGSEVSMAESLGALLELQREGKLRHIGLSNVSVEQLEEGAALTTIACVQTRYGLLDREHEPELRWCAERDIAFVPFFPLGSAFGGKPRPRRDERVKAVATRLGCTPSQVALAWLLQRDEHILLIPGTSRVAHLEENVAAGELELDEEALATLP
ncbi:MAG: oxidoreductase [Solirubrobacteraceae bacterium]